MKINQTIGNQNITIGNIQFDSRKVDSESVFVAVKGTQVDGHDYIAKAIEKGAKVIICETLPNDLVEGITYITVESSAKVLGQMASEFYGNPSEKIKLVGITGTNGKTTTATILYKLFMEMGYKTGLLSTVENERLQKTI